MDGQDDEEFPGAAPEDLHNQLGVEGPIRAGGMYGAGHPSDEENETPSESSQMEQDEDWEDEPPRASASSQASASSHHSIQAAVATNIRHAPIKVPRSQSPFDSDADEYTFLQALDNAREAGFVPNGYGLREDEEGYERYNPDEVISVGKAKRVYMPLPEKIWGPRVIEWVQAVVGLTMHLEDE